jgi:mono/diheme cytochrome c family protein
MRIVGRLVLAVLLGACGTPSEPEPGPASAPQPARAAQTPAQPAGATGQPSDTTAKPADTTAKPADTTDWVGQGARLYATYCASCHGVGGRGDGPVAALLRVPPADLTRLAERYGEPLPADRLADFVDGRRSVAAHGPREMPVWGEQLYRGEREGAPAKEAARSGTVLLIVEWLETIQTTGAPPGAR